MGDFLSGRPWAQAPWELVTCPDISAMAFRVAMAIQLHRSAEGEAPFPGQRRLAAMCNTSVPTVERAIRELKAAGVLRCEQRVLAGRRSTNRYWLGLPSQPSQVMGGPAITGDGAEVDFSVRHLKEEPAPSVHGTRVRRQIKVNGKLASTGEIVNAEAVLTAWNIATTQQLRAESWLALIIRRHREHPEVEIGEFAQIIDHVLSDPWWEGAPSPNLVFGSDMQFERCMTAARAQGDEPGHGNGRQKQNGKRFGVGATTSQLREHFASK